MTRADQNVKRTEHRRHRLGRRVDRALGPLWSALGRLLGRPSDALLFRLTGRERAGPDPARGSGYVQALEQGRRELAERRFGEALFHFGSAAEVRPGEAWPWHGRGDALQLSGDHAGALAAYDAALERAPDLALAHNGQGNALEALGRTDDAVVAWEEALTLDPRLSWPREGLERVRAGRRGS